MDSWTRTYLGSLLVLLVLLGVSPAQDEISTPIPQPVVDAGDISDFQIENVIVDEIPQPEIQQNDATGQVYTVHLHEDGHLEGRVRILHPTGKVVPAEAQIQIARDGDAQGKAETDENGFFKIASLQPGEYVATASIDTGSADFQVEVLPFKQDAGEEMMVLNATLTPEPTVYGGTISECSSCGETIVGEQIIGEQIIGEEIIGECGCGEEIIAEEIIGEEIVYEEPYMDMGCGAACGGGFSGGGCCGGGGGAGGGGLGWLLGAGGLAAGIAIPLALNDDDARVASPATP